AGVVPMAGVRLLRKAEPKQIAPALGSRALERSAVSLRRGTLRAYSPLALRFAGAARRPGTYVYAIRLTATSNRGRSSLFVGKPFTVR
ncbi:MAG: hypothetical protein M3321_12100, partial [Actinomycetota bacterium]|nr:hypothetical protein [Actinomycetota bacterium]